MKRPIALVLSLVFVLYLGGIEGIYLIKIKDARSISNNIIKHNKVEQSNVKQFSLNSSQYDAISWVERNKEFDENGQRYDVISIHFLANGNVQMECYNDSHETDIVDAFKGFMEKMFSTHPASNNGNNEIINKIYKEYLPNESLVIPDSFSQVLTAVRPGCVLVNATSPIAAIWHPPCI